MYKILIVDDDDRINDLLFQYLTKHGFVCQKASDAFEAESLLKKEHFDLMVLDIMMPNKSGFQFAKELRENNQEIPILFLTAKTELEDKIKGLELGADDYLTKPFEPKELLLRISAVLRRTEIKETLAFGPYILNEDDMLLIDDNQKKIYLNNIEMNFLKVLIKAKGEPVSREELLEKSRVVVEFRTIDVQIMRLRQKIEEDPKNPIYLKTIRNKGYILQ